MFRHSNFGKFSKYITCFWELVLSNKDFWFKFPLKCSMFLLICDCQFTNKFSLINHILPSYSSIIFFSFYQCVLIYQLKFISIIIIFLSNTAGVQEPPVIGYISWMLLFPPSIIDSFIFLRQI